jgi:hypothetical protein
MQEGSSGEILSSIQSSFLPWFGYFGMIKQASKFVILDDVQFDKNGWRNRNRINNDGNYQWITVPVRLGKKLGPKINEIEIDYSQKWIPRILGSIENSYRRSPHYSYFASIIETAINKKPVTLHALNYELINRIVLELEIHTKIELSSEIASSSDRNQRLVDLARYCECSIYLSGQAASSYLNVESFNKAGIQVLWYEFDELLQYPQQSMNFLTKLSIIDLLMNLGSKDTSQFLDRVSKTEGLH